MRGVWLGLVLVVAGCSPTFRVELLPRVEDEEVVAWRMQVTEGLNEHEARLKRLERGGAEQ